MLIILLEIKVKVLLTILINMILWKLRNSSQPPLFPLFILLSPLQLIDKIYTVMALIFTTWE